MPPESLDPNDLWLHLLDVLPPGALALHAAQRLLGMALLLCGCTVSVGCWTLMPSLPIFQRQCAPLCNPCWLGTWFWLVFVLRMMLCWWVSVFLRSLSHILPYAPCLSLLGLVFHVVVFLSNARPRPGMVPDLFCVCFFSTNGAWYFFLCGFTLRRTSPTKLLPWA